MFVPSTENSRQEASTQRQVACECFLRLSNLRSVSASIICLGHSEDSVSDNAVQFSPRLGTFSLRNPIEVPRLRQTFNIYPALQQQMPAHPSPTASTTGGPTNQTGESQDLFSLKNVSSMSNARAPQFHLFEGPALIRLNSQGSGPYMYDCGYVDGDSGRTFLERGPLKRA